VHLKRHLVASLLPLVLLCGCNKRPSQTASALNSDNDASAATADSANPGNADAPWQNNGTASNPQSAPPANTPTSDATAENTAPAPAPAPTPAPTPLVIPAGTSITIRLQQGLSSASSVAGERFEAVLDQPLVVQDQTVVPVGTEVLGHVVVARRSGRLRHPGELALTLDAIVINQQSVPIVTSDIVARGASHKRRDLGWIGGGTGGGALIGALAGGGEGALIGGGIGAAAGTTTAFLTGKKDVGFGTERRLRFRLHRDLTLPG